MPLGMVVLHIVLEWVSDNNTIIFEVTCTNTILIKNMQKHCELGSKYFQNIGIKDIILTMKLSSYVLNMKSNSNKDHE